MKKMYFIIFLLIGSTFAAKPQKQDIIIIDNELEPKLEEHAIGKALILLADLDSYSLVAKGLAKHMDETFGKQWMCFVGKNFNDSGFEIEHQNQSYISFEFKETQFVLFKPHSDLISDPIIDARKDNPKIVILIDMEEKTKITIINVVKIAIKHFNDYENISLNVSKTLQTSLGNEWRVVIINNGFDGNQDLYKNISIPGSLVSFRIESIEFVIFRLAPSRVIEDKLTDLIGRARNSSFKVIYEKNPAVRNVLQNAIKTVLNKNFPNCQKNDYTEKMEELCFNTLATEILSEVKGKIYLSYMLTATVGKSNRCFTRVYVPKFSREENHLYLLSDMYFEFMIYYAL